MPVRLPVRSLVATLQGAYFALTGAWAIVSIDTFMLITGDKTDVWLVKTVGVLVIAIGATILLAGWRSAVTPEIRFLAISCAAALAVIDCVFVFLGTISPIYLLDAFVEVVIIVAWLVPLRVPHSSMPENVAVETNRIAP